VIDYFIDKLDISGLGFKAEAADTGRPGYHPRTMLKILDGIRSWFPSRDLHARLPALFRGAIVDVRAGVHRAPQYRGFSRL